jgi:hypothetical protein
MNIPTEFQTEKDKGFSIERKNKDYNDNINNNQNNNNNNNNKIPSISVIRLAYKIGQNRLLRHLSRHTANNRVRGGRKEI